MFIVFWRRYRMIKQLMDKIEKTKAPVCIGLDPMLSYVPEHILAKSFEAFGRL